MGRKPDIAALEDRIGYRFTDRDLLARALTHVSSATGWKSYQRLEFLGDRVLGLAVAELLYRAFPKAPEGELSRRLAELVRRGDLRRDRRSPGTSGLIQLGAGEAQSGGRRNHDPRRRLRGDDRRGVSRRRL